MKEFEFKISEKATYIQTGTVTVTAKNLKEAKAKALAGDYDHHGDNEILLDSESDVCEREIEEVL